MKRNDIDETFYQKDRNSSKGKKKNQLKESDSFERKKKIAFKNYVKDLRQVEEDGDEYY
jgi:hypothetical protein